MNAQLARGKEEGSMSVARICSREVELTDADESVWSAAQRMQQRAVGALAVLDAEQSRSES